VGFLLELPIANFRLPISQCQSTPDQLGNWQLEIDNNSETPNSGQGAKRPDRIFARKAADSSVKFFGSNASASILP
jgi:hypothetical protein